MSYIMQANGLYLSNTFNRFEVPRGVSRETMDCLYSILKEISEGNPYRSQELMDIADLYDGGDAAISESFFPKPDGWDYPSWNNVKKRLIVLVNLVKASAQNSRTRVYGGLQQRKIITNPYKDGIQRFVRGWHAIDMRSWFNSRITFGPAVCGLVLKSYGRGKYEIQRWLPDPVYTYLICDASNPRDYLCVAEVSPDGRRIQFITKDACGVLTANHPAEIINGDEEYKPASWIQITDMGFLPAVVSHGEEPRNRRNPYSCPGGRDAIKTTLRATDILLNGSLLQKLQTKGVLAVSGLAEQQTMDFAEMMRRGFLILDQGGELKWAIPDSKIPDTIALMDKVIEVYGVVSANPVDDLNPTSSKGVSAEEAMRRSAPFVSIANEHRQTSELYETDLVLRATALMRWSDENRSVDLRELADEVQTEISIALSTAGMPEAARIDTTIKKLELGVQLDEDAAREWNPQADEDRLAEIVSNMEARRDEKNAPKELAGEVAVKSKGVTNDK